MDLKIKCKVLLKLPIETGTSKNGKEWQKGVVIVETDSDSDYPKKLAIQLFGDKVDKIYNALKIDNFYELSLNVESKEFNGRWFTEVSAWRYEFIDTLDGVVNHTNTKATTTDLEVPTTVKASDELPF